MNEWMLFWKLKVNQLKLEKGISYSENLHSSGLKIIRFIFHIRIRTSVTTLNKSVFALCQVPALGRAHSILRVKKYLWWTLIKNSNEAFYKDFFKEAF